MLLLLAIRTTGFRMAVPIGWWVVADFVESLLSLARVLRLFAPAAGIQISRSLATLSPDMAVDVLIGVRAAVRAMEPMEFVNISASDGTRVIVTLV